MGATRLASGKDAVMASHPPAHHRRGTRRPH
nr:MAG TPA: hypothetical protein [Caudoviricetes sp.]